MVLHPVNKYFEQNWNKKEKSTVQVLPKYVLELSGAYCLSRVARGDRIQPQSSRNSLRG